MRKYGAFSSIIMKANGYHTPLGSYVITIQNHVLNTFKGKSNVVILNVGNSIHVYNYDVIKEPPIFDMDIVWGVALSHLLCGLGTS